VLGVDEHTALVADLTAGTIRVEGRGGVTVRARDHHHVVPAGTTTTVEALLAAAAGSPAAVPAPPGPPDTRGTVPAPAPARSGADASRSPLLEERDTAVAAFDAATRAGDTLGAAEVTLALVGTLERWSADSLQSDELDQVRDEVRRQLVALARLAALGLHEHRDLVAPHVELLLDLRDRERAARRYAEADAIRDALRAGGVEVHDGPTGTAWTYDDPRHAAGS
jgi:hypothetical protein